MRRLFGLLTLCCIYCSLFAQPEKTDSFTRELSKHPLPDTNRLNILYQLAFTYIYRNPDKGLSAADEALQLAKKLNNPLGMAHAYHGKGACYYTKANYDSSLYFLRLGLAIFEKARQPQFVARSLNRIGSCYLSLSDYKAALSEFQKMLVIADEDKTNNSLIKALKGSASGNIALIYYQLGDNKKTLFYDSISLQIFQQAGDSMNVANMYNNLADIHLKNENYDSAIAYDLKALRINDSLGSKGGRGNNYSSMGTAYLKLKKYSQAIGYLNKSVAIFNELGAKSHASQALAHIADLYDTAPDSVLIKNGIKPSERFEKVVYYQNQAIQLAKEIKDLDNLSSQWKAMSAIYEHHQQFEPALAAYKEYTIIHDSIAGDKKQQDIVRQEVRFEAEKKEAILNAEHASALKRQQFVRNLIIAGSVVLLIAGLSVFSLYKRRRDAVEKQKEAELKSQVSETEMKALRAQMNPHFIFNSLNSISDYIAKNKTELADEYLTKFAKLMRLVLENSEKKEVPLSEDLKALELYMQLEALRLSNNFTYKIEVDEDIDKEATLVPPLILQPFVENSIWHGIAKKKEEGNIFIHIKREGEMINCIVEDNGIGRQTTDGITTLKDNTGRRSLGMKITNERIDIINKVKKTNAAVKLTDLQQGTKLEVKLPLILSF